LGGARIPERWDRACEVRLCKVFGGLTLDFGLCPTIQHINTSISLRLHKPPRVWSIPEYRSSTQTSIVYLSLPIPLCYIPASTTALVERESCFPRNSTSSLCAFLERLVSNATTFQARYQKGSERRRGNGPTSDQLGGIWPDTLDWHEGIE
jgi:hypothetical protein